VVVFDEKKMHDNLVTLFSLQPYNDYLTLTHFKECKFYEATVVACLHIYVHKQAKTLKKIQTLKN